MHFPAFLDAALRRLVPIACVDALPYQETANGTLIGLIRRVSADGKRQGWNLVGGRVRYREALSEALDRHLRDTLGADARWEPPDVEHPVSVAEYFPDKRPGARHDPRKHAVALGYVVKLTGSITPTGEALDFRWFPANELPPDAEIGFDQANVVSGLANSLLPGTRPAGRGSL
jgi:ADP-ribose pyrophosphatase YjhB (NUDIX family)